MLENNMLNYTSEQFEEYWGDEVQEYTEHDLYE